jgi:hypothetical protein
MIHTHYRKLIKKKEADKLWGILPGNAPANVASIEEGRASA